MQMAADAARVPYWHLRVAQGKLRMGLAGNVETVGLAAIFQFIANNSLSGVFTVKGEQHEIRFAFNKGDIFFPADGRRQAYSLTGALRSTGRVPKDMLAELKGDESLAKSLVERGVVSHELLESANRATYEEEIYDIFLWPQAYFEFRPGGLPRDLRTAIEEHEGEHFVTNSIVMEAANRTDALRRIRMAIPSGCAILTVDPSLRDEIGKALGSYSIELQDDDFDGVKTIQETVDAWGMAQTEALTAVAELVEQGKVKALDRRKSLQRFRASLSVDLLGAALNDLAYLIETDPNRQLSHQLGLERELIESKRFFQHRKELRLALHLPGPRAFQLLAAALASGQEFTYTLRQDEHHKRIAVSGRQLALASSKPAATPRLVHFLRRSGAIDHEDAKRLWRVSGKKLHDELIGGGRVSQEQWILALAEKIAEELVEVFFWHDPKIELSNHFHPQGPRAPVKINLPIRPAVIARLNQRAAEFRDMTRLVPSEKAIYVRTGQQQGQVKNAFYTYFDGQRTLSDVRRYARAGPLEFFRFVHQGVKTKTLRPLDLEELRRATQDAISQSDQHRVWQLGQCLRAFDFEVMASDLLDRIAAETSDLDVRVTNAKLEGDLEYFGFAEIFQTLTQERMTGTLTLTGESQEKTLYFHRGEACLLRYPSGETRKFMEFFLGKTYEEESVEDGLFNATNSYSGDPGRANLILIKEQILNVFLWKNAKFCFTRNVLPDDFWMSNRSSRVERLALGSQAFLMQVLQRMGELDGIRQLLPNDDVLVEFVSTEHKMGALGAGELPEVVMIIDGRHSAGQLVKSASCSEFELLRFLHRHLNEGSMRVVKPTDFAGAWGS